MAAPESWQQLVFATDARRAPALAELLEQAGALAVTMEDRADQPIYEPPPGATPLWSATALTALFSGDHDISATLASLRQQWPDALPDWQLQTLAEQDWTRAWMDDFQPMRFGRALWIVPSWSSPPDPAATNILLDPGLAFGTGTHPTTRLCLEWLDAHPPRDAQVIDYGCGSGILALAAALLGAPRVLAIDNDPQALIATAENAARNRVTEQIETCLPTTVPAFRADLLLANILAGPLIELAPRFAELLQADGKLVLSGILPEQAAQVAAAYTAWFAMQPPTGQDGWIRLEGRRRQA